jgi:hypothetical protein
MYALMHFFFNDVLKNKRRKKGKVVMSNEHTIKREQA